MAEEAVAFYLNDGPVQIRVHPAETVLDLLRKRFALYGTKEGCREGECGTCTVVLGSRRAGTIHYRAMPSCLLPAGELRGGHLVTIEGLASAAPTPIQRAFVEEGAAQCGFCTPGFLMAMTGYLLSGRTLSSQGALDSIDGNLCRCTGYASIRRAVLRVFAQQELEGSSPSIAELADLGLLPQSFPAASAEALSLPDVSAGDRQTAGKETRGAPPSRSRRGARGRDIEPTLLAGGTDLYIRKGDALGEEPVLLLAELGRDARIVETARSISVPAATTIEELRLDPVLNRFFPGLETKLLAFGSTILRNRATAGGNLVNASPIGDLSVLLTAVGAGLDLRRVQGHGARLDSGSSRDGRRTVAVERFFLGYKRIDLRPGEIVDSIDIPKPPGGMRWGFARVARRERLDIPAASAALMIRLGGGIVESARVALGGVAPVPLLALETAGALLGRPLDADAILRAVETADGEILPIDDVRGSARYRRALTRRLLISLFLEAFPELLAFVDLAPRSGDGE